MDPGATAGWGQPASAQLAAGTQGGNVQPGGDIGKPALKRLLRFGSARASPSPGLECAAIAGWDQVQGAQPGIAG